MYDSCDEKYNLLFHFEKTAGSKVNIQIGTCIKVLIWPPLEPKTEYGFSQFFLSGLLEE